MRSSVAGLVATIALTASGFDLVEMHDVAKRLRDDLYTLDGTKKVVIHGDVPERVELVTQVGRQLLPDEVEELLDQRDLLTPLVGVEVESRGEVVGGLECDLHFGAGGDQGEDTSDP